MPIVKEEDLDNEQKEKQLPKRPSRGEQLKAEIQKGQVNPFISILAISALTQYAGIDLAHLLGAYLIIKGLPALAVNLKTR